MYALSSGVRPEHKRVRRTAPVQLEVVLNAGIQTAKTAQNFFLNTCSNVVIIFYRLISNLYYFRLLSFIFSTVLSIETQG